MSPVNCTADACILRPAAASPAHIALTRNRRAPDDTAAEALELELTVPVDDLPWLLAYSATAVKQPKERFQITL